MSSGTHLTYHKKKQDGVATAMNQTALQIGYDRYSMLINGKRELIRSGAMHYFRLPGESLWRDRLFKLKAAGYNTVDLYFNWSYHSPAPGVYDFSGIRDVRRLLEIVAEMDLYLIARPGPYINAEYTAGGLPGWLLAKPDVVLRNRDESGAYVWSQPYMDAVTEWWDQIIPIIREYPKLLLVQIENEYATLNMEPDYMQALYNMTRDRGITVPLMHNDMYTYGLFEEVVDIYAFDNYSVTQFETDWREMDGVFAVLDGIEDSLRPFCQKRPLMVAELQAGWFAGWKGVPYQKIIEHLGREHIGIVTKTLLGQGLTLFNHYKAIGGTNWDYTGSTDTYTSYDFGAPISETGLVTERLYEAKALNLMLQTFDLTATERCTQPPVECNPADPLYVIREAVAPAQGFWLFFRNLSPDPISTELTPSNSSLTEGQPALKPTVQVKPFEVLMLPYRMPLQSGLTLMHTTLEPVYQTESVVIFKANREADIVLGVPERSPTTTRGSHIHEAHVQCETLASDRVQITCQALHPHGVERVRVGNVSIFLLGDHWVDRMWLQEDGFLVCGPEMRLAPNEYAVSDLGQQILNITPHGEFSWETDLLQEEREIQHHLPPIQLKQWESFHEAPELYTSDGFKPVSPNGADFDTNGLYEGSAWYRHSFDGSPKSLTILARHIWAVFLNGQLIGEGHHWQFFQENAVATPEKVAVPEHLLKANGPNELVLFVDGLGHPKGFHDDARTPQGLILLKLDDEEVTTQVTMSAGLSCWKAPIRQALGLLPPTSPIVRFKTCFKMPPSMDLYAPLGVALGNLDFERINIYVNGVLIGRHWRACQNQTTYYIPDDLLKAPEVGENTLELIAMNFQPLIPLADSVPNPEDVSIQPYGVFTKVTR
jgi:hypothetical protein